MLRFWPPINAWGRLPTRDVDIDGTVVPAGAQVAVLLGSGNRDPRHYDDPDAFLVTRNPVDHLAFGYGPHGCAGQGLARLEAHAVIEALSRRVGRLVAGPEVRVPSNTTRSIEELPVLEVIPA
ncbi:cytochrome P450 [Streptomyces griseoflavus]|uniref:cytochrome P450 n=1 Tax=Streptomyces griseoflavus TaxID=35619 RepID=UPI0002DAF570|nr:cytochrome P450 [Streptomyces griseoflavus]